MHELATASEPLSRLERHLTFLYGAEAGADAYQQLSQIMAAFCRRNLTASADRHSFTQSDTILITYGDQVQEPGLAPLQVLGDFLKTHLHGLITGVHILPFFPYSSDDGFSIIDYLQVDPALGVWDDIAAIGCRFDLMFDAVINHISAHSKWFQGYVAGDPAYADFFIAVEPDTDLSQVTRPRALPLLTSVQTAAGERYVWTTFSADQIDLNYANPAVLIKIIEVLLYYVEKGASLIRLDAIAYLWKIIGTNCIHLEQTHQVIQLLRAVLDEVAPEVKLITETNVPHLENISYLGDGTDEAQMVYQFPLAPLLLNAIQRGRADHLSRWAAELFLPTDRVTFMNFTASHDGVGVMPVRGILSEGEIQALVDQVLAHGGHVSYKDNPDGSQSVYELNISYFDALSDPKSQEPHEDQVNRFMVSQAIMLALQGVPGIYFHSLFGSRSWQEGVDRSGHKRAINRQRLHRGELESALSDPTLIRHLVFGRYAQLLRGRTLSSAFHPHGAQRVISSHPSIFALLRTSPDGQETVLCLHNVSDRVAVCSLPQDGPTAPLVDLITGERYRAQIGELIRLEPYQTLWLAEDGT